MSQDFAKDEKYISHLLGLAANELMLRFGRELTVKEKADTSIVTDADLAAERAVLAGIRASYPDDKIFSEEAGLSSKDRTPGTFIWIVDPLDGTTNFANRYPFFCTSIARGRFRDDGSIEVVAGGVGDPCRGVQYLATLGQGARRNGELMKVATPRSMQSSFLVTGFYYHKGAELRRDVERFLAIAEQCQSVRRDGSAALDLALVAEGIYDGFWERGLMPWDVAAGALIVTEAGGAVVNYGGALDRPFDIEGEGMVAGHREMVTTLLGFTG